MSEVTPSLTDKSYPPGSQMSNTIIIVLTIKDFSVHINPDANNMNRKVTTRFHEPPVYWHWNHKIHLSSRRDQNYS